MDVLQLTEMSRDIPRCLSWDYSRRQKKFPFTVHTTGTGNPVPFPFNFRAVAVHFPFVFKLFFGQPFCSINQVNGLH